MGTDDRWFCRKRNYGAVLCLADNVSTTNSLWNLSLKFLGYLAYAGDLALLASTQSELKERLAVFNEKVKEAGMEISFLKTEVMILSSEATDLSHLDIRIDGKKLKVVSKFNYLGSIIITGSDSSKAVASNCKKARLATLKLRAALVSGARRLIEIFIKPLLLYGLETSITRKKLIQRS